LPAAWATLRVVPVPLLCLVTGAIIDVESCLDKPRPADASATLSGTSSSSRAALDRPC
jgi:hypothetical protein